MWSQNCHPPCISSLVSASIPSANPDSFSLPVMIRQAVLELTCQTGGEMREVQREKEMLREAKSEESLPSLSPFFFLGEMVRCQHQCTLLHGWAGTESCQPAMRGLMSLCPCPHSLSCQANDDDEDENEEEEENTQKLAKRLMVQVSVTGECIC